MSISILNRGASGGLKPELTVTAPSGSTLYLLQNGIIVATYTLGVSETEHTFTVRVGTYTVRGMLGTHTKSFEVVIDTVGRFCTEIVYGVPVSSLPEGSLVKLNENGSPVEFYVAKHDYEPALNGTGRTLLVRKPVNERRIMDSYTVVIDCTSFLDADLYAWLNADYKNRFESTAQEAMGITRFYHTNGLYASSVSPVQGSVFIPSYYEMGYTYEDSYNNVRLYNEGSILPIANRIYQDKVGSSSDYHNSEWTRSRVAASTGGFFSWGKNADGSFVRVAGEVTLALLVRPCFTFPETALFDPDTMLFTGWY